MTTFSFKSRAAVQFHWIGFSYFIKSPSKIPKCQFRNEFISSEDRWNIQKEMKTSRECETEFKWESENIQGIYSIYFHWLLWIQRIPCNSEWRFSVHQKWKNGPKNIGFYRVYRCLLYFNWHNKTSNKRTTKKVKLWSNNHTIE